MAYDKKFLADQIKKYRKGKGWTQDELADHAGTSKDTIVSLETERRGVTLDTVFNLSEAFGCSIDELVCPENRYVA